MISRYIYRRHLNLQKQIAMLHVDSMLKYLTHKQNFGSVQHKSTDRKY